MSESRSWIIRDPEITVLPESSNIHELLGDVFDVVGAEPGHMTLLISTKVTEEGYIYQARVIRAKAKKFSVWNNVKGE